MQTFAILLFAVACSDGRGGSDDWNDDGGADAGGSDDWNDDGGADAGGSDDWNDDGGADAGGGDGGADAPLVINEFMASNATTIADPAGGYADWIELYNPTAGDVSLDGWTITDDRTKPDKFALDASLRVPAGGWLLLWADADVEEGPDHLSFRLDAQGEEIGLFAPDGSEQDGFSYGEQATDISAARVPDGSDNWILTDAPTPGASNGGGR